MEFRDDSFEPFHSRAAVFRFAGCIAGVRASPVFARAGVAEFNDNDETIVCLTSARTLHG
jgi:hypothetical protein